MMYRPTARSSEVIELKVSRILTMIGELVPSDERAKQWAGRTRERFEEALLTLQKAGILAAVQWPSGYGPGDPDRFRGEVSGWLNATVRIVFRSRDHAGERISPCPPLSIANPAEQRAARVDGPGRVAIYQRLRAERIARGWTQEQLAADLRVSAAYISFDREWPTHSR